MRRAGGFTLIEILAVLAVMGILLAMAVPSYLDIYIRQQIQTALPLADIAKTPIAASWAANQSFPADNTAAGLPPANLIVSNLVSSVSVQGGAINITFGNRAQGGINGKILTLRPAVVVSAPIVPVAWVCGNAEAPANMTVWGANQTNVPVSYLPIACQQLNHPN